MSALPLAEVYDLLGRGEWQLAQMHCRLLLRDNAGDAAVHHALGLSLCGTGAYDEALGHMARAADAEHAEPRWRRDAGALYAKAGRWSEAVEVLSPVLPHLDTHGLVVYLTAAIESQRVAEALDALTEDAIRIVRDDPEACCTYGKALLAASRYTEAEAVLKECVIRWPGGPDAHQALAHAHLKLALAHLDRGDYEASRLARAHAERLGLTDSLHHAARLYMMLSDPKETASTILAAGRLAFTDRLPLSPTPTKPRPRARGGTRLRVGYLSGDFHSTPSYYFTHPFLANHDRDAAEVFLYCSAPWDSDASAYYASLAEHCLPVSHMPEPALIDLLRRDRLDVLVHMAGHFTNNRLSILCDRVAPVQAQYPHFPATTGCPGMDYLMTDRWTSPIGSEDEYSEHLYRVPSGHLTFATPENGPSVAPSRRLKGQRPTFGIFQRLAKFNAAMWDAIAAVLSQAPDALLLIHNSDAELDRQDSPTAMTLKHHLAERGIDPERLRLRGPAPYLEHLAIAGSVDVALDTFPYGGQTTTCESLWMGVPVVTLMYPTHAGRISAAILQRAGHDEWVAHSVEDYARIAASLAGDVEKLVHLRQHLRSGFVDAGLADGRLLARELETAYHTMS